LNSDATKAWIQAQNEVTFRYLESLPQREPFRRRITELWNYPKVGLPWREGGRIWYLRDSGLQRQAVLYSRTTLDGSPMVVIAPHTMPPDGVISLAQSAPSPDGTKLA